MKTTRTIKITPEIEKDIKLGIEHSEYVIKKEMQYPTHLRDYKRIIESAQYIKDMLQALNNGELL